MARDPNRLWRAFHPPAEHYDVRGTAAFALTLANRALRRYVAADRFDLGLYEGRDLVMLEIARLEGRATAAELVASLGLTAGSVSTVLRRSELVGYIRRARDHEDRRVWRLSLTEDGLASAYGGAALWRAADEALRTELTDPDLEWLRVLAHEARTAWLSSRSACEAAVEAGLRRQEGSR